MKSGAGKENNNEAWMARRQGTARIVDKRTTEQQMAQAQQNRDRMWLCNLITKFGIVTDTLARLGMPVRVVHDYYINYYLAPFTNEGTLAKL